jgi:hypothetical protein
MNSKAFACSYVQYARGLRTLLAEWSTLDKTDRVHEVEELTRLLVTRSAVLEDLRARGSKARTLILEIGAADEQLRRFDDAVEQTMGLRPTHFFTQDDTTVRDRFARAEVLPMLDTPVLAC